MSDEPFDLSDDRELDMEDYAFREDDDRRHVGVGCCFVFLGPLSAIIVGFDLFSIF